LENPLIAIKEKVKQNQKKIVFPESTEPRILNACKIILDEKIAIPILVGKKEEIQNKIKELNLDINPEIIDPSNFDNL